MRRAFRWTGGRAASRPTASISSSCSGCCWRWSAARHGPAGWCGCRARPKRTPSVSIVLVAERTGHGITGLSMAPGIRDVSPRRRDFVAHLQTLRTGDGEPLPPHTEQALRREHERLCLIERQIREIEAAQAAAIKAAAATPARQPEAGGAESGVGRAALLMRLKGLGQIGAVVLSREVF